MHIQGFVTYVNLSGGFWGIQDDKGLQYAPIDPLPAAYQQEGLRVTCKALPADVFSIFMWGTPVSIQHIEKSDKQ